MATLSIQWRLRPGRHHELARGWPMGPARAGTSPFDRKRLGRPRCRDRRRPGQAEIDNREGRYVKVVHIQNAHRRRRLPIRSVKEIHIFSRHPSAR